MTGRELQIWLVVGVVAVVGLGYNMINPYLNRRAEQKSATGSFAAAQRLLRAENNICARNRAVFSRYRKLRQKFFLRQNRATVAPAMLALLEDLVADSGLRVRLKNILQLSADEIGVALEGSTSAAGFYQFLQRLTVAPIGFNVKTLQLRSIPKKRELDYQIVVSVLLVD
jgi:hypothetical protein